MANGEVSSEDPNAVTARTASVLDRLVVLNSALMLAGLVLVLSFNAALQDACVFW